MSSNSYSKKLLSEAEQKAAIVSIVREIGGQFKQELHSSANLWTFGWILFFYPFLSTKLLKDATNLLKKRFNEEGLAWPEDLSRVD